jgi:excisionase family DNA binding protein
VTLDELSQDPQRAQALTATQVTAALAQLHAAQGQLAALEGTLLDRLLALQAQPAPVEDELLPMPAAAKLLGIPESKARELGRRGELETVQVGKYVRVSRRVLKVFMAGGTLIDGSRVRAVQSVRGRSGGATAPRAPAIDPGRAR